MIVGSSGVDSKGIPIVTLLIIICCSFVFLKTLSLGIQGARESQQLWASGSSQCSQSVHELDELYDTYGFQLNDLKEGDFLSIFTCMFVHAGIFHIAGNMLAFWAFAVAIEELFGSFKFAFFYVFCGIVAALAEGLLFPDSALPMVGASGAVAGVMGAYLVLLGAFSNVKVFTGFLFGVIEVPTPFFMAFWLLSQLWNVDFDAQGGVAIMAHLGGFGVGAAIALYAKSDLLDRIDSDSSGDVVIAVKPSKMSDTPDLESDRKLLAMLLETRPFDDVVEAIGNPDIACLKCNTRLDLLNPIGERLVRCEGATCGHMTYVDGDILSVLLKSS